MKNKTKWNKTSIKPENVFTIGTAKVLTIEEVNAQIRRALHTINGKHLRTYVYWFHNGSTENADRHFHLAFTRDLRQTERDAITKQIEFTCRKNNWGRIVFLTRWGVTGHSSEKDKEMSTMAYLAEHKHCIGRNVRK